MKSYGKMEKVSVISNFSVKKKFQENLKGQRCFQHLNNNNFRFWMTSMVNELDVETLFGLIPNVWKSPVGMEFYGQIDAWNFINTAWNFTNITWNFTRPSEILFLKQWKLVKELWKPSDLQGEPILKFHRR